LKDRCMQPGVAARPSFAEALSLLQGELSR
jgi:hypothetical protein